MSGNAAGRAAGYLVAITAVLLVLAVDTPLRADDPVSTTVSFNREIIRIIERKCAPCHASGGLAMSLSDYREARAWGRAIREELVEHRMPPALMARGYGRIQSDPSLTAREMATFLTWLDGGMPRGSDADLPARASAAHTDVKEGADLQLPLPPQTVPAGEPFLVRRITIDAGGAAGRKISRVQLRPGNRRVLAGAVIFAGNGLWIGGWLPWQHAVVPPLEYGFTLPSDGRITVDLYYRGTGSEPAVDRSAIDVSFAPEAATGHIENLVVEATAAITDANGATNRARGSVLLPRQTTIWAMQPAIDALVSSMEVRIERPDKSVEVLMWIPSARADWPLVLAMQEPITLPANSTVSLNVETARGQTGTPRVTLSVLR
jgi:hypothetical protein